MIQSLRPQEWGRGTQECVRHVILANVNNRRSFLTAALASAALAPKAMRAQRDWSGKEPVRYPDPDILALDKRFAKNPAAMAWLWKDHAGVAEAAEIILGRHGH